MRNKILIVDANSHDIEQLEQILQEFIEEGGELIFTKKREDGVVIIKKEQPQLVFLDATLVGDQRDWVYEGIHIILTQHKHDRSKIGKEALTKPFKRDQVLVKCRAILQRVSAIPMPPM